MNKRRAEQFIREQGFFCFYTEFKCLELYSPTSSKCAIYLLGENHKKSVF